MNIRTYKNGVPNQIPMHANDVNVSSYLIYVNRNNIACFDEAGFYPINAATLENLYAKGVLISENGVLYTPLSKTLSETDVALAFLAYDVAESEVVYRVASSSEEAPAIPFLASLSIGSKTLTPAFDPEVFLYSMSTEDESDILTLTTVLEDTTVVVKLNDVEVTDYEEGIVWGEGENVVTITVGDEPVPVVYTITVTKSIPEPPTIIALASLTIGDKVLTPSFDPAVFEYATATEDVSNILAFTTLPENEVVEVKLGNDVITTYGEGIVWGEGENVITITVGDELVPVVYTITVTKVADPIAPCLASLTLGTSVLTPSFDPDVFVYTAPTTETSDVLTLTALPPEAVLEVKLGENVVTDYDDTGIVWGEGENVVTITVGDELVPVVYTITVTKS